MITIIEAIAITAAVMLSVHQVELKTLAIILSAFGGIVWLVYTGSLIGSPDLESQVETELKNGLLPKSKD